MPWVVDDVCGCRGQKVGSSGELRNPNFPTEVAVGEDWTGTIDAVNIGTATNTFRIRINAETGDPFALGPGAVRTISESGTGPADFWIYLDRWVPSLEWVEWLKKNALLIGVASTCVVGLAVAAVKV